MRHIRVTFDLCDRLNAGFGYQLRIENAETGRTILFTSRAPDTGDELLTAADCLRIVQMYVSS